MFQINDYIVYPNQGLGRVTNIQELPFKGSLEKYYIISISSSDMVIKVPESSIERVGIRPIISKEEAERIYNDITEEQEKATSDWKVRYNSSLESLKKSGIEDFIKVVKTLNSRSKVKELPIMEKKLYEQAWNLLVLEFSISLGKDTKFIEKSLKEKFNIEDKEDISEIDNEYLVDDIDSDEIETEEEDL